MPASREDLLSAYQVPAPEGKPPWPVYQVGCTSTPLNFASQQMRAFALMWALDTQDPNASSSSGSSGSSNTANPSSPSGTSSSNSASNPANASSSCSATSASSNAGPPSDPCRNWLKGKRVAIVGGGFAGVTAGIVAMLRGAEKVALYERTHELIPLQHGSTRDIRPFIYGWPNEAIGFLDIKDTENVFPVLYWKSGTAHSVRESVLSQAVQIYDWLASRREPSDPEERTKWRQDRSLHKFYQQFFGTEVLSIVCNDPHSKELQLLAEGPETNYVNERNEWLPVGPKHNYNKKYDLVIVAAGFGLERIEPAIPFRSYWHTDSLAQPIYTVRTPWRVVISGTGDGGLTDAIRARLFDVDLTQAIDLLCGKAPENFQEITDRSKELKKAKFNKLQWPAVCKKLRTALTELEVEAMGVKSCGEEAFATFLDSRYRQMTQKWHPQHTAILALSIYFKSRQRTDTLVYLRGFQSTPYTSNASPLFRFIVFLLREYCGLEFLSGTLRLPPNAPDPHKPFEIQIVKKDQVPQKYEVDEVYIRHGADPALAKLFGETTYNKIRKDMNAQIVDVEKQLWIEELGTSGDSNSWTNWKNELIVNPVDAPKLESTSTAPT